MAVVVDARARFLPPLLSNFPPQRVVIQPENRGSAPAILYGLLRIMTSAPKSPVVVFPADYHVSNDASFTAQVETAIRAVVARPDLVILLGVMPDSEDVDDRWIGPREVIAGPSGPDLYRARHFWKKPSPKLPPMEMTCSELIVKDAVAKHFPGERLMTIGRTAILTQAHNGRAACHQCGPCARGCITRSYFSSLNSTLPAALKTGKVTVRPIAGTRHQHEPRWHHRLSASAARCDFPRAGRGHPPTPRQAPAHRLFAFPTRGARWV
jgi:hypothetical protein